MEILELPAILRYDARIVCVRLWTNPVTVVVERLSDK